MKSWRQNESSGHNGSHAINGVAAANGTGEIGKGRCDDHTHILHNFTHTHIYIYNVIIYALYTYMIYTNPHRTDEIGSGCLRGDMM